MVVLVGAGGSIPFIPRLRTEDITEWVVSDECTEQVLEALGAIYEGSSTGEKDQCDWGLLVNTYKRFLTKVSELRERSKKRNQSSGSLGYQLDFEAIVHLLDRAVLLWHNDPLLLTDDKVLLSVLGLHCGPVLRAPLPEQCWNFTRYVPGLLRNVILDYVARRWQELDDKGRELAKDRYRGFLQALAGEFSEISVYTLNYDPLLYEAVRDTGIMTTGFENSPRVFRKVSFWSSQRKLAFLHGHVGFVLHDGREMRLVDDYRAAFADRMNSMKRGHGILAVPDGYRITFNTFMITGHDKWLGLDNEPFVSYYQSLAIDIPKVDLVVIIGYSLRDQHINLLWRHLTRMNSKLKLLFVDKWTPEEITSAQKGGVFAVGNVGTGRLNGALQLVASMGLYLHPGFALLDKERWFHEGTMVEVAEGGYWFVEGSETFLQDWHKVLSIVLVPFSSTLASQGHVAE